MRPDGVVVSSPVLDQYVRFPQRREDLAVQKLVPELRVEALAIAVLPWASRFDAERLDAVPAEPFPHIDRDELGAVVGANVLRRSVGGKEVGQTVKHVIGSQPPCHDDCQTPARELVEHDQHAEGSTVMGAILHEVVGPDVVGPLGPETHARPVVEPETTPLRLLHWDFQPFPAPDPIDALDVDPTAFGNQHRADAAIAVTAIAGREPHDVGCQCRSVVRRLQMPSLRRTWLSDDSTRAALRDIQARTDVLNTRPLPGRA